MEKSQMKNIVVLKNLPSNIIEEAFVIVKSKKIANSLKYIDGKDKMNKKEKKTDEYIIREAESVISSYINIVENKEKKVSNETNTKKYNALKLYSIAITICLFFSIFF